MSLFSLPPGADFADSFARGFWARYGARPPERIARIQIWLNNRRTLRAVEDALAATAGVARLLPRLDVVGEIGADPLALSELPGAIDPLRRRLHLTRLVTRFLAAGGDEMRRAPASAAADLADSLAALLDEFDEEGRDLADLDRATEGEHAEHWARNLAFLEIIRTHWPAIAAEAEGGAPGPKSRQRQVLTRLLAAWEAAPPRDPVLLAASTGSVPSTAELMAAVARLAEGAVILPAFEPDLPAEIWEQVASGAAPEHPFAPFRRVLGLLDAGPGDLEPWQADVTNPRRQLLTQAMRPAPVTDAWHRAGPSLAPDLAAATAGMALLEAPSPRHEAVAIAAATRLALEDAAKTVVILTPNAGLARRISAALARFGIEPDDSMGRPLAESPPGTFLRLIAELATSPSDPVRLAGLLQHPLTRPGLKRGAHLAMARRYELEVLRQRGLNPAGNALPSWGDRATEEETEWRASIASGLAPLSEALASRAPFSATVSAHVAAAEALSQAEGHAAEVWAKEAGATAYNLMHRIEAAADAYGNVAAADYPSLLLALMRGEEIRPEATAPHPRVTLLGPREGRIARADLTVLAGLNEGTWPAQPGEDPWLSRPMRQNLGLAPPERRIGLAALDFLHAAAGPEVLLTRAEKEEGSPTIATRWLIRLETLIAGIDVSAGHEGATMAAIRARGSAHLDRVADLDRPVETIPRAERPSPRPPLEARPTTLAVTAIERLVRDPYAVYARHILRLKPLDPLDQIADYRDRGTLMHEILHAFAKAVPGPLPQDAHAQLLAAADQALADEIAQPMLRRVWRARVARFADWFLAEEAERRANLLGTFAEVPGEMTLAVPPGFTLTARADRIDLLPDGQAAIYDYKASAPPSHKQIELGFNHQLHLQAAILAAGGFDDLPAAEAALGAYLGLTGQGAGGAETRVDALHAETARHLGQVGDLLTAYSAETKGYTARRALLSEKEVSDYDHLSRFGEWETGDG